jgi:hypothetical protein
MFLPSAKIEAWRLKIESSALIEATPSRLGNEICYSLSSVRAFEALLSHKSGEDTRTDLRSMPPCQWDRAERWGDIGMHSWS